MVNSLVSGLSGLRVHQQLIDVVGNNLANSNTPGYKGSRATFAEILTAVLRTGAAPTSTIGGVNPQQIGLGVRLGTIDVNFGQGSFVTTGRTFDMGIQGGGFFIVNDGRQNYYTRAGTFGLDSNNDLIDLKNGYKVLDRNLQTININTLDNFPPQKTSNVTLKGNLPAKVDGPKAAILTSESPFVEGAEAVLTGTNTETFDFSAAGDETFKISINGGSAVTIDLEDADFVDPAAATAAEVAAAINADLLAAGVDGDLLASDNGGAVELTTTLTGTKATIKVTDGSGSPASDLGLSTTLEKGTESTADEDTELNDLPDNLTNYADGDEVTVSGTDFDGSQILATFTYGAGDDGTTLGDLRDFINGLYSGAELEIDEDGNFTLTADETGETSLSLALSDDSDTTSGVTVFATHALKVSTKGTGPDQVVTSIPVYDSAGLAHNMTLTFERSTISPLKWDMTASIPTADGTIESPTLTEISFDSEGKFQGAPDIDLEVTFAGQTTAQTIVFDFGDLGEINGLTQFGDQKTAQAVSQDGFAPGTLSTISIRQDGVIEGVFTNGQVKTLAELGVATFANPAGLLRQADTLYSVSTNSGEPNVGAGTAGAAGAVVSGVLENSNVDVAEEFVRLVEAQRGFQAAAKVIQTTDQMLADLNTIR